MHHLPVCILVRILTTFNHSKQLCLIDGAAKPLVPLAQLSRAAALVDHLDSRPALAPPTNGATATTSIIKCIWLMALLQLLRLFLKLLGDAALQFWGMNARTINDVHMLQLAQPGNRLRQVIQG